MVAGITQDALDRLFTAALEAAVARVEKDGHFFPLVFELRPDATIHTMAMLETEPVDGFADVLDRLAAMLRERAAAGTIAAAAIVLQEPDSAALTVRMRASNYSADVTTPYSVETEGVLKRRRRLTLGEATAAGAPNDVF